MKSSINNRLTAIRRAVGLGASYLMPRNRRKWVFGGLGNDNNAAYLFIWLNENNRFGIKPVWLGTRDTVKKMRSLGYKAHTRYGLPALWHSLTSGVWLFTSYISELRTYAHGPALLVNLWHGVGIKSIERKISSGPLAEFYAEKSWVHRMNHHDKFKRPDRHSLHLADDDCAFQPVFRRKSAEMHRSRLPALRNTHYESARSRRFR